MLHSDPNLEERFFICSGCSELCNEDESMVNEDQDGCICFDCIKADSDTPIYKCDDCGNICTITEESFDYPGAHCTGGQPGTHHTGHYYSDCCDCEYEEI